MLEHYEINSIEQLRTVSDMLRMRIVDILQEKPMTVTQLGETLGMAPAKVHYHVRELERVGLLRLVETREKGGILEKYYQPIAHEISVAKDLLFSAPSDELLSTTNGWFEQIKEGFQRALRKMIAQKDTEPSATFAFSQLYLTHEELKQLGKQIEELLKPYAKRREVEGEREMLATLIIYPQETSASPTALTAPDTASMSPEAQGMLGVGASISADTTPFLNTWVVGVSSYNRATLEKMLTQGKRLHINSVGLCRFDDDVSAELADYAVEQFKLLGKLQASPAVREVLQRKRTSL